ncbi:putative pyrroloquinoline-quinone binding quinoprotein [Micromonospora pisi]|uniref:Putative pyrroloquinoline-quinone binding quinoprotein n=1 Tax=Micromonospora pisi TaxID=589240 RepID=A0A495JX23_9ACTN|nr:PQQ-binding-like beta-propeller repeat protein [Micromonospora pisi]RKR93138.1 putative pyrroloquinoline-quinone binding quinoprotein [Micromonospora pisi]
MESHPVALIDLGTERGVPEQDRPRSARARRVAVRWPVLCLTALLVLVSVTAAQPLARDLRRLGELDVPARAGFFLAGDLLLVVDTTAAPMTLAAYDLPRRDRLWEVPVTSAASFAGELVGDLLLVAEMDALGRRIATTARSVRSGQVRWQRPGLLLVDAGTATGVAISEVRSASGAGRRIEGTIETVDLATGSSRWSLPLPSTAVGELVPGTPGRLLVLHDSSVVNLHDLRTGAVVATGKLPPADYAPDNPVVVGGQLVLRHPGDFGESVISGYTLPQLTPRWSRPGPRVVADLRDCGGLVCVENREGATVLDPATGAQLQTGTSRRDWGWLPRGVTNGARLLLRPAADRPLVAVERGVDVHILGALPPGVMDCRVGAVDLVCRTGDNRLGIWRMAR